MVDTSSIAGEACPRFTMNDGSKAPVIGLGTFGLKEQECVDMVKASILEHGYRHIDTAKVYENEEFVGQGLKEAMEAGVKREDLYVCTKLWHNDRSDVEAGLRESLRKLQLDYVDLYLIHWMRPNMVATEDSIEISGPPHYVVWKELEACVKKGLIKSIGVSNATIPILLDVCAGAEIKPVLN